jgi:hypothetical protein
MRELELPAHVDPTAESTASGTHGYSIEPVFAAITQARATGFAAIDESICRAPGGAYDTRLEQARRQLVIAGASARARGVALQHARVVGGDAAGRWVARRLYGGPWPIQELEEGVEEMLTELVAAAQAVANVEMRRPSAGFELLSTPSHCSILALAH